MITLKEFKEDYDWREALNFAPFSMEDISEILAEDQGCNDGESWVCLVKLKNGSYGFVDAWCDYTGWDCQSGGTGEVHEDLEHLKRWEMNSSARRRLGVTIADLDDIPNAPK